MNNERYLFRGKRIDNGDWVYGSLMQTIDQSKVENVYHMAHIYEGVNISAPIKVITETVGQFTGLTDKNCGVNCRIFEGDLLSLEGEITGNIYDGKTYQTITNIIIPIITSKDWITAYKTAMDRGCKHA